MLKLMLIIYIYEYIYVSVCVRVCGQKFDMVFMYSYRRIYDKFNQTDPYWPRVDVLPTWWIIHRYIIREIHREMSLGSQSYLSIIVGGGIVGGKINNSFAPANTPFSSWNVPSTTYRVSSSVRRLFRRNILGIIRSNRRNIGVLTRTRNTVTMLLRYFRILVNEVFFIIHKDVSMRGGTFV